MARFGFLHRNFLVVMGATCLHCGSSDEREPLSTTGFPSAAAATESADSNDWQTPSPPSSVPTRRFYVGGRIAVTGYGRILSDADRRLCIMRGYHKSETEIGSHDQWSTEDRDTWPDLCAVFDVISFEPNDEAHYVQFRLNTSGLVNKKGFRDGDQCLTFKGDRTPVGIDTCQMSDERQHWFWGEFKTRGGKHILSKFRSSQSLDISLGNGLGWVDHQRTLLAHDSKSPADDWNQTFHFDGERF